MGLPGELFRAQKAFSSAGANPRQINKDVCTYCQTRYGFDYYYVFDGQNTEARRACNGGKRSAHSLQGFPRLSKEDEATLFALQTGISTCLTAGERLRANLVARNPDAIHL